MTKPRSQLIDLQQTPYYHCINRCVRRSFLCGEDHLTGKNYEHRKVWIVERLALLSRIFAIEVAAYAVMSNHYHVVLRVDKDSALKLNDQQIAVRWRKLYQWPLLVENYLKGQTDAAETDKAQQIIQKWRNRLHDISWFMRCLNEHLARKANKEDNCTGKFWEGRFKSQALLGEAAVLTCMAYVDLNPIRAGVADTPETSDHTSVQKRIEYLATSAHKQKSKYKTKRKKKHNPDSLSKIKLMPLVKQTNDKHPNAIGYTLKDYLELIDWIGRSKRNDKRGAINDRTPPILQRLELNADDFIEHVLTYDDKYFYPVAMGPIDQLIKLAQHWKQKFIKGQYSFQRLYFTP